MREAAEHQHPRPGQDIGTEFAAPIQRASTIWERYSKPALATRTAKASRASRCTRPRSDPPLNKSAMRSASRDRSEAAATPADRLGSGIDIWSKW